MSVRNSAGLAFIALAFLAASAGAYDASPFVIPLDIPAPGDSAGGILVADLNGDGLMDYLVTVPGHITACANDGRRMWTLKVDLVVGGSSEAEGLPGHHGPGVAAGDVDDDGKCEVVFLTKDGILHVIDGAAGRLKAQAKPAVPEGAQRWELAMIADFRGTGKDTDILLQATNAKGYRMGRFLAAFSMQALLEGGRPLWMTDAFVSCAHNGARLADLDGDGRDEVLGATILSAEGKEITCAVASGWHMDSVFVADVRPELPGLEVLLLEEGANYVQLLGMGGPIWRVHHKRQEPQNAAVGRFKAGSDEIFLWCRSRYNEHQKPFVFDSAGHMVFEYAMDDVAPDGWTPSGVELIHTIDWTGQKQQLACATERHKSGDVCLFEPLTGRFVQVFEEVADRLYVADVTGDWREEIIVLNKQELRIYENRSPNLRPNEPRKWTDRNYRRLKQCHNYYSP
ncbi:MAG: VCBS repeat-containing protein [Phycisphaerae bacterium]|nr:VCBS repeat-containing protein [Phycisphaerae bacterium]